MPMEVRFFDGEEWRTLGTQLNPGGRPGSLSDNSSGRREVYVFGCKDESNSYLYRSLGGADISTEAIRNVIAPDGMEVVCVLGRDTDPYELDILTDGGVSAKIRFRHY